MRKKKKTICRFAVTCVGILAVAAVLALTPIGSKNTNPPDPSSENKASALQTGESSCPVQSVLYYGTVRLGPLKDGENLEELQDVAEAQLGASYPLARELELKEEETEEPAKEQDELLSFLEQAVKSDYTDACGVFVSGQFAGALSDEEEARKAVLDFEKAVQEQHSADSTVKLQDLCYKTLPVLKDSVLAPAEFEAILALCCEEKLTVTSVDYEKIKDYVSEMILPKGEIVEYTSVKISVQEELPFLTEISYDPTRYADEILVLSEGSVGALESVYEVFYENGVEVRRELSSQSILYDPVNRKEQRGTLPDGAATGIFAWTTDEGYISSPFGYRYLFDEYQLHSGIDIAVPVGTPLYAGDGGTVIISGDRGNSYGIYVAIDHGNGFVTYYGHMSKTAVKKGDKVNKGDLIGWSGETGRVTGPHVHYEFRYNGTRVNPANYLPKER